MGVGRARPMALFVTHILCGFKFHHKVTTAYKELSPIFFPLGKNRVFFQAAENGAA